MNQAQTIMGSEPSSFSNPDRQAITCVKCSQEIRFLFSKLSFKLKKQIKTAARWFGKILILSAKNKTV